MEVDSASLYYLSTYAQCISVNVMLVCCFAVSICIVIHLSSLCSSVDAHCVHSTVICHLCAHQFCAIAVFFKIYVFFNWHSTVIFVFICLCFLCFRSFNYNIIIVFIGLFNHLSFLRKPKCIISVFIVYMSPFIVNNMEL